MPFVLAAVALGQTPEPWSDAKMPIREGLVVWLDASVQQKAWGEHGQPGLPIVDGRPLDVWFDGSGHKRHFVQRQSTAQPVFRVFEGHALVRFDGLDDFFSSTAAGTSLDQFTVVAYVAPRSNPGGYRALVGASAFGRNDYTSGFNIDQSYASSATFDIINVEGAGFNGALDLMSQQFPFGDFHVLEVVAGEDNVSVTIDNGSPTGQRPRTQETISIEEFLVGARLFSNEAKPPFVQGFFHGDIAELLLFDRADRQRPQFIACVLSRKIRRFQCGIESAGVNLRTSIEDCRESSARSNVGSGLSSSSTANRTSQHQQRALSNRRKTGGSRV